ncbi:hypothetical protein [Candidatus Poriferisocius sp.]|uniref:hypothetical protein n=1 Tax=Candidatus Poriferisocius sp. TaxID=3101276 RepID=UPI003B021D58
MVEPALTVEMVGDELRVVGRWEPDRAAVAVDGRDVSDCVERVRIETVHCPARAGCGDGCQKTDVDCWHRARCLRLDGDVRVLAPLFEEGRVLVTVSADSLPEPFEFAADQVTGAYIRD